MTPEQESKLIDLGCLTVIVMMIILGVLAWLIDWRFAIGAALILFLWMYFAPDFAKMNKQRLESSFQEAFEKFEGERPVLKLSSYYGYSTFEVEFRTLEELALAMESGCLPQFRASVRRLHGFRGFDLNRGFSATYVGLVSDYIAEDDDAAAQARIVRLRDLEDRYYGPGR